MSLSHSMLSLNVRGVREPKKRREIFRWIKRFHNGANNITFLQETHSTENDEKEWKSEWGSNIIFSHGTSNSKGVAILLPINFNFTIENSKINNDGRKIVMNITHEENDYCLINIYAPTQDLENDQFQFFQDLNVDIENNLDKKLIVGGDFNLPLENIDKSNNLVNKSKAKTQLQQTMALYDIMDIWRVQNPGVKRYTWRRSRPITQSRLDYWLIGADLCYDVSKCDIMPSIKTDHSLITLKLIQTPDNARGKGLWKFNASLLCDLDYNGYIKGIIDMHCVKLKDMKNKSLKWELIKMEIRNATIVYSKTQAYLKHEYENDLNKEYQVTSKLVELNYSETREIQLTIIKNKLEKINSIKTEGYRIRARANFIENNEKGSKYFINLEKRNAKIKNITRIKLHDNLETTNKDTILQELANFYKKLYEESEYSDEYDNLFLNDQIPKININEKNLCDMEISIDECSSALNKMKPNKSPGTDGFTVEFLKFFWEDIKFLVHESILYAFEIKLLSCEQRRGVLRLIPKKDKDLTLIQNWRPISLLNTDYKLIAHVLSNRLHTVLPNIISKDQSGYLKGRNISINIRSIFDVIDEVQNSNSSGLLAFLDFEKAFDKLNWTFIQNSLDCFGFGPVLRQWVKILYTDIESCTINNGTTSKYFCIKSGIRQGCPLSALLFVIAVEILAIKIRSSDNINGIKLGDRTFKITQLADDTTLFLKDLKSLQNIIKLLSQYRNISGLSLNKKKTEILQIGAPLTSNYSLYNLNWVKERIYALGTWFYKDHNESINKTYEKRLEILEATLNEWSHRNLTWIGKITIIKTLCLSKINYAISSLEIPNGFIKQVKDMLEQFLWSKKPARIKNRVLYNDYDYGGLRMINLDQYIKAQKINWIKLLLNNKDTVPYSYISAFIDMTLEHYLKCNLNASWLPKKLHKFYKDVLSEWFSLKQEPTLVDDIQREVLWNNRFIMIGNKRLYNKKLYKNGLIFINDIINEQGKFITHQQLVNKFGQFITQYDYLCLKDAIPYQWRCTLTQKTLMEIEPNAETVYFKLNKLLKPASLLKSKDIYWMINTQTTTTPTCYQSWFEKYFIEFSQFNWRRIFTLTKSITLNTKLIEFQYKIIHRVYASDSYVSNFDNSVSKICRLCLCDNNIPHLFVDCIRVRQFWIDLKEWLATIVTVNVDFSTAEIIFGILKGASYKVNFCLLHAKWYIHITKQDNPARHTTFVGFVKYFEGVLIIEKEIAISRKSLYQFDKNLKPLLTALDI